MNFKGSRLPFTRLVSVYTLVSLGILTTSLQVYATDTYSTDLPLTDFSSVSNKIISLSSARIDSGNSFIPANPEIRAMSRKATSIQI